MPPPLKSLTTIQLDVTTVAGADVREVCHELVTLANRLQLLVTTRAHGVTLIAKPYGNAAAMHAQYLKTVGTLAGHIMATAVEA